MSLHENLVTVQRVLCNTCAGIALCEMAEVLVDTYLG